MAMENDIKSPDKVWVNGIFCSPLVHRIKYLFTEDNWVGQHNLFLVNLFWLFAVTPSAS